MRVASSPLATNNGLFYPYSDHLGSASACDRRRQKVNETRYLPFGGYCSGGPNALTDRGFTGEEGEHGAGAAITMRVFTRRAWAAS
ncbi:MAG: hypothetical protein IPK53_08875 [bacterium]|nr:hypothetical protein [bacterium]